MSSSTIAWRTSKTTLESSKSILESGKKNREREILLDGRLEDEPDGTTPGRSRTKEDEAEERERSNTPSSSRDPLPKGNENLDFISREASRVWDKLLLSFGEVEKRRKG